MEYHIQHSAHSTCHQCCYCHHCYCHPHPFKHAIATSTASQLISPRMHLSIRRGGGGVEWSGDPWVARVLLVVAQSQREPSRIREMIKAAPPRPRLWFLPLSSLSHMVCVIYTQPHS